MTKDQVKARIRKWLRENDDGGGIIAQPDLVAKCVTALLRDDAFCDAFLVWYLPDVVKKFSDGLIQQQHPQRFQHRVADRLMTTEQLRDEIATEETPWARWMTVETNGTFTTLLDMTKPQLLKAVEDKKRQGDVAYKDAAFLNAIADTIDGLQAVGDVWKANDLSELYDRISLRIKADVTLMPMITQGAAD